MINTFNSLTQHAKSLLDHGVPPDTAQSIVSDIAKTTFDNPAYTAPVVPVAVQPTETPLQSGLAALGGMVREAMKHSAKQDMPTVSAAAAAGMNQQGFEAHQNRAATATNQANAQAAEDARQEALLAERVQEQQYQREYQRQQLMANSVNSRAEMALHVDEAKYRAEQARAQAVQQAEDRRRQIARDNRPQVHYGKGGVVSVYDPVTGTTQERISPVAQQAELAVAHKSGGGGEGGGSPSQLGMQEVPGSGGSLFASPNGKGWQYWTPTADGKFVRASSTEPPTVEDKYLKTVAKKQQILNDIAGSYPTNGTAEKIAEWHAGMNRAKADLEQEIKRGTQPEVMGQKPIDYGVQYVPAGSVPITPAPMAGVSHLLPTPGTAPAPAAVAPSATAAPTAKPALVPKYNKVSGVTMWLNPDDNNLYTDEEAKKRGWR